MYYHLHLDEESTRILERHVNKLLGLAASLDDWVEGTFGDGFRFTDRATFDAVRAAWSRYADILASRGNVQCRSEFEAALKITREHPENVTGRADFIYKAACSAAPLGMRALADDRLGAALDEWWHKGTTGSVPEGTDIPNPLFSATLSKNTVLSYTCDPILSYHLATANAHLAELSPLKSSETEGKSTTPGFVAAAHLQFAAWTKAFIELAPKNWILEFSAADGLALCHTLQHHCATGKLSADFYRRQFSPDRLELDKAYGHPEAPTRSQFDVIDTSNLWESLGGLNILLSAAPLLEAVPWATLYTRSTHRPDGGTKDFEKSLCAPLQIVSTCLGITPSEYWTNATADSSFDGHMLSVAAAQKSAKDPGVQWHLTWKINEHLSGQQPGTRMARLEVREDDLVALVHTVLQAMFPGGLGSRSSEEQGLAAERESLPKYHCASFVAFIKRLQHFVSFDVDRVCTQIMGKKDSPQLSLEISRQGLHFNEWHGIASDNSGMNMLQSWPEPPSNPFITISIPKSCWKHIYSTTLATNTASTVEGCITGFKDGGDPFHYTFADVHVIFGTVETAGQRGSYEYSIVVTEDQLGWAGDSDIIATFHVPAGVVESSPSHTKVGLYLKSSVQTVKHAKSAPKLGQGLQIWDTDLATGDRVYITKTPPGQETHPIYNSLWPEQLPQSGPGEYRLHFTVELDSSCQISSLTGRLAVLSAESKRLLANKASVEVQKVSSFAFEVSLGNREGVYLIHFPVPVNKDGSKTRVARTSSYIEVVSPLAYPATAQTIDDFIFPTALAEAIIRLPQSQTIPATLNVPHLNLDTLPILDATDKERLDFLTTLASSIFSVRERKLREETIELNTSGLAPTARLNFKESLFTMYMLASGLQGGQTGLFAIHHPDKGGNHILIFVSALRLDAANGSVALDAAVIPFTKTTIESGQLDSFLLILRTLECCTLTVDDDELMLWKRALPTLAERCRTWTHGPRCEYAQPAASVPLSTEPGELVICSCGEGALPDGFISLPEWETAARFATRVAISPTFAVPLVEEVVDLEALKSAVAGAGAESRTDTLGDETVRCRSCGAAEGKAGGALKKCMRCLRVRYCSPECQKKDWKKHRMECEESEVYGQG